MALGSAPAGGVLLVLARVAWLIGAGTMVGAGISVWAARFAASLLYGLEPRDPVTLIGAVATLAVVGGLPALAGVSHRPGGGGVPTNRNPFNTLRRF